MNLEWTQLEGTGKMRNIVEHLMKPCKQTCLCLVIAIGGSMGFTTPALAQSVTYPGELNIPYGRSYRDENTPYNPASRSRDGNRLIINGRILSGDGTTLAGGLDGDFFSNQNTYGNASAVGNQLNVITNGNWNTVIIDNTQINNGDQIVNTTGAHPPPPIAEENLVELNGRIDLND